MSEAAPAAPAASSAPVETSPSAEASEVDLDAAESEGEVEATPEAPKPSNKKKYQLKANGKDREIELDFDNDDDVKKYLSKAIAADEKFQEAAMTRKQSEQLIEMLRTNPLAILKHPDLGIDVKALAQYVLNEELEDMAKTPEQKKLEEMEKRIKDYEDDKKRLEDEKRQSEMARIESEAFQQLDDQISSALAKTSLPRSDYTIKRIADMMIDAVNAGYTDVTVEQIMPLVEDKVNRELQQMFEIAPDEVFEKLVNKKRLDAYRKARVSKSKPTPAPTAKQVADSGNGAKTQSKQAPSELKIKDLFKMT